MRDLAQGTRMRWINRVGEPVAMLSKLNYLIFLHTFLSFLKVEGLAPLLLQEAL